MTQKYRDLISEINEKMKGAILQSGGLFDSTLLKLNVPTSDSYQFLVKGGFIQDGHKGQFEQISPKNLFTNDDSLMNIFEFLVNPVIFSNALCEDKLLLVFEILKTLEKNNHNMITMSSLILTIWYMFNVALFYSNFEDIHRRIESTLGRRTSLIHSAKIFSQGSTIEYDITYMMNTWLTSLRAPDLKNYLILGKDGSLDLLKQIISKWEEFANPIQQKYNRGGKGSSARKNVRNALFMDDDAPALKPETYEGLFDLKDRNELGGGPKSKFEAKNKNTLRIDYFFEGDLLTYEVDFDRDFKIQRGDQTIIKEKEGSSYSRTVLCLENTET
jgi:hypothetical protein